MSTCGSTEDETGGASLRFETSLDDITTVDVRLVRRIVLRSVELLHYANKWERLVDIVYRFTAVTGSVEGSAVVVITVGMVACLAIIVSNICYDNSLLLLLPLRLFSLLCGFHVCDKLPPHSPVMRLFARQALLRQVHIYTVIRIRFGLPFFLLPSTSILISLFPT